LPVAGYSQAIFSARQNFPTGLFMIPKRRWFMIQKK
jgi:hypothetical protein